MTYWITYLIKNKTYKKFTILKINFYNILSIVVIGTLFLFEIYIKV